MADLKQKPEFSGVDEKSLLPVRDLEIGNSRLEQSGNDKTDLEVASSLKEQIAVPRKREWRNQVLFIIAMTLVSTVLLHLGAATFLYLWGSPFTFSSEETLSMFGGCLVIHICQSEALELCVQGKHPILVNSLFVIGYLSGILIMSPVCGRVTAAVFQ